MNSEIEEAILETCIKLGKRGEGALFVLGSVKYSPLVTQSVTPFKITENPKLLESLAMMDGAVIINKEGILLAYGVQIQSGNIILRNFGTRHNSGLNASMIEGNVVFVVSEEDRKVRIFKEGKVIMEIDPLTKNIEKKVPEASRILESFGVGSLSTLGMGLLAPVIGITMISGITIFTVASGIHYIIKTMENK